MPAPVSQPQLVLHKLALRAIVAVFLVGGFEQCASAQPPMVISTGGKQHIVHDLTASPQYFPPQGWNIVVPNSYRGATVYWTCGPFRHVEDPRFKADAQLDLWIRRSEGEARWTAIKPTGRTNLASGTQEAMVTAASGRTGHAQVELQVSFLEQPNSILAAGDYEVTVRATITEN